jgi:hypothetical protein
MARLVPEPDSESLKHRFRSSEEKWCRPSLPVGTKGRQKLPHKGQILPGLTRQIIPLCRKQTALLLENFE